jgi:hypothetical protein
VGGTGSPKCEDADGLAIEYFHIPQGSWLPALGNKDAEITSTSSIINYTNWGSFQKSVEKWNGFAARWTGFINIAQSGVYTFFVESADGSQLFIDGKLIVDNDGLHKKQERSGKLDLKEGLHSFKVTLFQRDHVPACIVSWKPPHGVKEVIKAGNFLLEPESKPSCCPEEVKKMGSCQDQMPPCRLMQSQADPTCSTGIKQQNSNVCCKASCGQCVSDSGCQFRFGGASGCCPQKIEQMGSCDDKGPPCVLSPNRTVHTYSNLRGVVSCPCRENGVALSQAEAERRILGQVAAIVAPPFEQSTYFEKYAEMKDKVVVYTSETGMGEIRGVLPTLVWKRDGGEVAPFKKGENLARKCPEDYVEIPDPEVCGKAAAALGLEHVSVPCIDTRGSGNPNAPGGTEDKDAYSRGGTNSACAALCKSSGVHRMGCDKSCSICSIGRGGKPIFSEGSVCHYGPHWSASNPTKVVYIGTRSQDSSRSDAFNLICAASRTHLQKAGHKKGDAVPKSMVERWTRKWNGMFQMKMSYSTVLMLTCWKQKCAAEEQTEGLSELLEDSNQAMAGWNCG